MQLGLGLSLLLTLSVGCHKSSEGAAAPAPAPAPQVEPNTAPQPSAAAPAADTPDETAIPASKAKDYLVYQAKLGEAMHNGAAKETEVGKKQADGKYEGAIGTARALNDMSAMAHAVNDPLDAARKQTGMTEDEATGLQEIAVQVYQRAAVRKQIADQVAEMEKAVAQAPPDQRASAEHNLAELKTAQAGVLELKEMREKYGAAVVDAMIAHEAEIVAQFDALKKPTTK
jgi:hypothetical protein